MAERCHGGSRELPDRFDTRRLADRLDERTSARRLPPPGRRVFPNCPRYIHRMALVERSRFVPRAGVQTPVPEWKRGPLAAGVLPSSDGATG